MQSLNKAFMGPLKTFSYQEFEKYLRSHPGRVATIYQIGELFEMHKRELQHAR
jgi:hypothetical protein